MFELRSTRRPLVPSPSQTASDCAAAALGAAAVSAGTLDVTDSPAGTASGPCVHMTGLVPLTSSSPGPQGPAGRRCSPS